MHATELRTDAGWLSRHLRSHRVRRCLQLVAAVLASLPPMPGWTAEDAASTHTPLVSADGSEVIDDKAGIAWSRCLEGMHWASGRCTGSPQPLGHAQALAAASQRHQADGKAWRLPRVRELQRLSAQTAAAKAAQPRAPDLFPGAVGDWHWSSSTTVDTSHVNPYAYGNIRNGVSNDNLARVSFLHGWAVQTGTGEAVGQVAKRTPLLVRLVRTIDP